MMPLSVSRPIFYYFRQHTEPCTFRRPLNSTSGLHSSCTSTGVLLETKDGETRHGKNVRHHAAEPRRPTADLENEHERCRIENDLSSHKTKERRQPAGNDRPNAKNGRQDGSLHNVHGHHGHQRRGNHRRRGLRRCSS